MAGYTRQSLATIINGADITAPPINSEFNQLLAAFNANTGHAHDGSTGSAPKINLTTSITGYLPAAHGGVGGKNKFDATSAPSTSNDAGEGYAPGSMWENVSNGRMYICVGNTSNSAVWREMVTVISSNQITPITTNSVDLGTPSIRFQDAYLSGGLSAAGNVAIGGTLTTTGTSAFTGLATFANLSATGTTTITSVDLNSGAIDNATIGSATPAAGTFTTLNANTSLVAATADINGGTIDGAALGGTTPSTGAFTTLGASGTSTLATVDINGGNIDGTVIGASTKAAGSFTTLSTTGQATLATADINGGSIDGSTIGASSASTGAFTTLTASGGITGSLTGNVTGNTAGVHTGAVNGNVTGNLTGNVTASSGTSTFTNVVVNGNLNMNAGTSATITNLTAPSADLDAATKKYVDDEISGLIGDAGAGLDTLGELADALNDDDAFSTTVTNSIATKLPKAGGTMTGAIAMSTNKITGVGNPTSAQDVSTKVYTDTQRDTRVAKTGDTMSGALAMGNNKITGLATPTANTDVTNKAYVDGILGSATAAATSATNAATSATNAATSATSSANSAASALTSKNAAATSLATFQNQYLGAQSSAPTQDPDGSALDVGDLYFDTVANAMKVYSSSGWTNAGSSVNGTSNRVTYTATAGQTVFAATYDSGYIDVFLNGVKLLSGTDFTATNGTSITLIGSGAGASVNDVVDIVSYGTFALADHYTRTASDARYVNVAGDTMTGNLLVGTTDTFPGGGDTNTGVSLSSTGAVTASRDGDFAARFNRKTNDGEIIGLNKDGAPVGNLSAISGRLNIISNNGSSGGGLRLDSAIRPLDRLGAVTNGATDLGANTARFKDLYLSSAIKNPSGNLTLDASGEIILDADGSGTIRFNDNGINFGMVYGASSDFYLISKVQDKDMIFQGNDGGSNITALTLDMSNGGRANFNNDISLNDGRVLRLGDGDDTSIYNDGSHFNIVNTTTNQDIIFKGNDDGSNITALTLDMSNAGKATFNNGINSPSGHVGLGSSSWADDILYLTRSGNGKMQRFFSGTNEVGSIGVDNTDNLTISGNSSHCGLNFSTDDINPYKNGAYTNGTTDLGSNSSRFKDLHLSGGIQFDARSNKLDDYEEGTWTPTLPHGGTVGTIIKSVYTKVGNLVNAYCNVMLNPTNNVLTFYIGGLPFVGVSSNHGGGALSYTGGMETRFWSGPLVDQYAQVYFHRHDASTATVQNNAFGGANRQFIMQVTYILA